MNDVLAGSLAQAVQVQQIIDALKGTPNKGVPVTLVSLNDPNNYALTVQNDDPTNSKALSVLKADGTALITADATGVTLGSPVNLPAGSITSAMIADGTITSADMAAAAATRLVSAGPGAAGSSTTSNTAVAIPSCTTASAAYLGTPVLVMVSGSFISSALGSVNILYVQMDAAGFTAAGRWTQPVANNNVQISLVFVTTPGAGNHTFTLGWSVNTGTLSLEGTQQPSVQVLELRR